MRPLPFAVAALLLLPLLAAPAAAATANCEALRSQIEARIRAAGVAQLSVTVVDAASPYAGKVVGSCDGGSKKLVYRQLAPPAAASGGAAAARPPRSGAVITECKDGSVVQGGDCRRP